MRMIGELKDEAQARTFGDYLYAQGIENQIDLERDGSSVIWVHADEHLDRAKELLENFKSDPTHRDYQNASSAAGKKRKQAEKEVEELQKRTFDRSRLFPTGIAPMTLSLMIASIFVFARTYIFRDGQLLSYLYISVPYDSLHPEFLAEVKRGQVWRLITPIFIHGGVFHIFFNMWMLKDFGTILERRHSAIAMALFTIVVAAGSNLAQYYFSGPYFGGMSGVVYGLFGYLWLRGKFDPDWSIHLHPSSIIIITVWYFAGFLGLIQNIANIAHLGGLVIGGTWGFLAAHRVGGRLFK